jgi:hypothetical protein
MLQRITGAKLNAHFGLCWGFFPRALADVVLGSGGIDKVGRVLASPNTRRRLPMLKESLGDEVP